MTKKQYRPWNPEQDYLFPPRVRDWLPAEHLAFFVGDVIESLDIAPIERAIQGKDPRGEQPYHPRMMLAVWVYGYAVGIVSSRGLERAIQEDVAFRVLAGNSRPHFTRLNEFRRVHREHFGTLFVSVLLLCQEAGLIKLGHVAIDGSKIKADASKHKAMSYERMKKDEERLRVEVEQLLNQSDEADADEDARYGAGQRAFELPDELKHREGRLRKLREIQERMEAEARVARAATLEANATNKRAIAGERTDRKAKELRTRAAHDERQAQLLKGKDDDDPPPPAAPTDLPTHATRPTIDGKPKPDTQMNFTDPDSCIMMGRDGFIQAYNAQAAVDADHQIIVAVGVTNQAPDPGNLVPMVLRVRSNLGAVPTTISADCGYWSEAGATRVEDLGVEPLVPQERTKRWKPGTGRTNIGLGRPHFRPRAHGAADGQRGSAPALPDTRPDCRASVRTGQRRKRVPTVLVPRSSKPSPQSGTSLASCTT